MDCFYCQVEHERLKIPMTTPLAVQQSLSFVSTPHTILEERLWFWINRSIYNTDHQLISIFLPQWSGLIAINYAARKFGVKRGMTIADAKKACKDLVCVHVELIGEGGCI
eukprot:1060644-Amorphochlora_amoeboformis.AAC.1